MLDTRTIVALIIALILIWVVYYFFYSGYTSTSINSISDIRPTLVLSQLGHPSIMNVSTSPLPATYSTLVKTGTEVVHSMKYSYQSRSLYYITVLGNVFMVKLQSGSGQPLVTNAPVKITSSPAGDKFIDIAFDPNSNLVYLLTQKQNLYASIDFLSATATTKPTYLSTATIPLLSLASGPLATATGKIFSIDVYNGNIIGLAESKTVVSVISINGVGAYYSGFLNENLIIMNVVSTPGIMLTSIVVDQSDNIVYGTILMPASADGTAGAASLALTGGTSAVKNVILQQGIVVCDWVMKNRWRYVNMNGLPATPAIGKLAFVY